MKKSLILLAGMAAILAACTKELRDENLNGVSAENVTITAAIASDDVRTALDGNVFSWGDSETISVVDGTTTAKYFVVSDAAAGTFTGTKEGDFRFAATPASAFGDIPASGTTLNVYLPGTYSYTGNKTETNALMLAGAPEEEGGKYKFTFRHAAALVKFTVENIPVGTKYFEFTSDQYISGYAQKDVSGTVSIAASDLQSASRTVLIGLENEIAVVNSSKVFYVPVPVGDYSVFNVRLLDGTQAPLASKSKTLATPVSLARADIFETPVITLPGTSMPYACLTYDDYDATDGTGTSYKEITVVKTHGDAWETNICKSGGAMQIGRFDSGSHKDSYIKLPDFTESIRTVTVTLKSVTADKTITLETSADGTDGSVASVTTTDDLVYTFDLSTESYKTAYLRVSGAATLVSKVEVLSGTDTRTALSAPTGVTASLNTDDSAVTNAIDISWNAVENAGSYEINMLDAASELSTFETSGVSFKATGLKYDTEYLFTVKAVPADPYVYTPSAEADADQSVTTGSEPGGAKFVKVTSVAEVVTGEYVIAAYVGGKYYAMSNSFATKTPASEIGVVSDKIAEADAENYVVTLTVDADGKVSIYNGSNYLNCATSGTNFTVGKTAVMHLLSASSSGAGTFRISHPTTTTRAVLYQAAVTQFGNYATSNAGNGYYDVELFKKEDNREDPGLAWSESSATASIGNGNVITFTQPTLANPHDVTVTYNTGNASVATVDATTGVVEIAGEGETKISAVFEGNTTYKPVTVSYTLTVTDNREAVATPTFNPAAGEVESGTEVAIVCAAADAVYYTTDGSTPSSESGTLYSAPVAVTKAVTIKAIAYKAGYKPSEVASASYTVKADTSTEDREVYRLTPANGTNNNYANNCDITINGITWNLTGNSTQNPWRIGGKSLSNVDRALYSKTSLNYNISEIAITHGAASSIKVNSMTVIVASDANFNNVVSTLTPTFVQNGTVTVNRPDGKDWSDCYYKIVYNVTVSGSSNRFIEFTSAVFTGR